MTITQRPNGYSWAYLDRNRPRRAVFYGRVSTEHEAQLSALENQMQWYDDQLRYFQKYLKAHLDRGAIMLYSEFKYNNDLLLALLSKKKSI